MDTVRTLEASEVASGSIYLTLQNLFTNLIGVFGLTYLASSVYGRVTCSLGSGTVG